MSVKSNPDSICYFPGFCSLMFHPISADAWKVFFSRTDSVSSGSTNLCYKTNSSGLMVSFGITHNHVFALWLATSEIDC